MSRIAVVGGGISGIYSAYQLTQLGHQVTLFEAGSYLGGHTNTHQIELEQGIFPVDSGFIVFNDATYPLFCPFLEALGVSAQPAPMSFSVHCETSGFEYGSNNLKSLLARRRNLTDLRFYRMIRDIFRFNRESARFSERELAGTLGDCLSNRGYSEEFLHFYIVPMAAAIWSAPGAEITRFPLDHFIRFLGNHGLLSVNGDVQWQTIPGGSDTYVKRFCEVFKGEINLDSPVLGLQRTGGTVKLVLQNGESASFDEVVLACHSDQALKILGSDASAQEREILGALPYQSNRAILHDDVRVLPLRKSAWSAWNYRINERSADEVTVSYWMNHLQNFEAPCEFMVTLNDHGDVREEHIHREIDYSHPTYTPDSDAARGRWQEISGKQSTHFCGAYWFSGFHEDGVRSAQRVCDALGKEQVAAA